MKLIVALVAVLATAVIAAPAFAGETVPVNPWPAKKTKISMYVDTVTASPGESGTGIDFSAPCTQMNLFRRGEGIVIRMWAFQTKTGKVLTDKNTKFARVFIPGVEDPLEMRFGAHGATRPGGPWGFWTTRWDVPIDYPLGVVDFDLKVAMKKGKKNKGTFKQVPLGALTLVETRPVENPLPS